MALDADAMAVCQRLRDPGQCVLDSWNTTRLTGEIHESSLHRVIAGLQCAWTTISRFLPH